MTYRIDADWDNAAGVWIATSADVPGLHAEAASLEALIEVVVDLAPDLLVANNVAAQAADIPPEICPDPFSPLAEICPDPFSPWTAPRG